MKLGTRGWVLPALALLGLAGCGADAGESVRPEGSGPVVIRVPQDATSIGAAVVAARTGDLVLVSPGVYRESVRITTPGLVLRGTDRNRVVIDGEVRRSNGVEVTAGGVAVENLTDGTICSTACCSRACTKPVAE